MPQIPSRNSDDLPYGPGQTDYEYDKLRQERDDAQPSRREKKAMTNRELAEKAADEIHEHLDFGLDFSMVSIILDALDKAQTQAATEIERLQQALAKAQRDAQRYQHMRANAKLQDRNGPGIYWYLPRWNRQLPVGERLDAAVDDSMKEVKP